MKFWLIFWLCWIVFGAGLFFFFDRDEMKKHVPYGFAPSITTLRMIRWTMFLTCFFLGVPLATAAILANIFGIDVGSDDEEDEN